MIDYNSRTNWRKNTNFIKRIQKAIDELEKAKALCPNGYDQARDIQMNDTPYQKQLMKLDKAYEKDHVLHLSSNHGLDYGEILEKEFNTDDFHIAGELIRDDNFIQNEASFEVLCSLMTYCFRSERGGCPYGYSISRYIWTDRLGIILNRMKDIATKHQGSKRHAKKGDKRLTKG